MKPTGGVWSTPANISNNPGDSQRAVIATDAEGTLHVLWDGWNPGYWDIFYTSKPSSGFWSSLINISNNGPGWSWSANLAVDSEEGLHAVWTDTASGNWDILYASTPKGGAWSSPIVVPNNPGGSEWAHLSIDSSDTLHLVWQNNASGNLEILYAKKLKAGSWSMPVNLSNSSGDSWDAAMAIGADGTLHVAWFDYTPGNWDIYYTMKPSGDTWSTPANISNNTGESRWPSLALDTVGTLHMVWADTSPGNWEILYANKRSDRA